MLPELIAAGLIAGNLYAVPAPPVTSAHSPHTLSRRTHPPASPTGPTPSLRTTRTGTNDTDTGTRSGRPAPDGTEHPGKLADDGPDPLTLVATALAAAVAVTGLRAARRRSTRRRRPRSAPADPHRSVPDTRTSPTPPAYTPRPGHRDPR